MSDFPIVISFRGECLECVKKSGGFGWVLCFWALAAGRVSERMQVSGLCSAVRGLLHFCERRYSAKRMRKERRRDGSSVGLHVL